MEKYQMQLDTTFKGVFAKITLADFAKLGYEFGDSFDFEFSNGKKVYDIPYYNGYYTKSNESLLCGYQGYPYVYMSFNQQDGYWRTEGLQPEDTVIITLHQKGKYKAIQDTFNLVYSNQRKDFKSDEIFANFREIQGGKLKKNWFYRGASPIDNEYARASYVDCLLQEKQIQFDVNLSDGQKEVTRYTSEHDSPYFGLLYQNDQVVLMHMGASFTTKEFAEKLVKGFREMLRHPGPYYIHCVEGKDRTGFVVAVLLALAHSNYQEIVDDYMITYDNYYGINLKTNEKKYLAIKETKIDDYLMFIGSLTDQQMLSNFDFTEGAKEYLRFGSMNEKEIEDFVKLISD